MQTQHGRKAAVRGGSHPVEDPGELGIGEILRRLRHDEPGRPGAARRLIRDIRPSDQVDRRVHAVLVEPRPLDLAPREHVVGEDRKVVRTVGHPVHECRRGCTVRVRGVDPGSGVCVPVVVDEHEFHPTLRQQIPRRRESDRLRDEQVLRIETRTRARQCGSRATQPQRLAQTRRRDHPDERAGRERREVLSGCHRRIREAVVGHDRRIGRKRSHHR